MDARNFTADDLYAIMLSIFYNLNLKVYDNGITIADNVLNAITK